MGASVLITVPVVIAPAPIAQALNPREVGQIAQAITVRIEGQNPGSGVLIGHQDNTYTVLTAAHVVATADEYDIVTPDEQRYSLDYRRVKPLPQVDLALVEFTSDQTYTVAEMGDARAIRRGDEVYVSGFPMPSAAITEPILNFSPGAITAHSTRPLADGYALVYTNRTLPGMSGGAVLDEQGDLIGIHGRADTEQQVQETATIYLKTGFNLGIPIYTFQQISSQTAPVAVTPAEPTAEDLYLSGGHKSQQGDYQGAIADIDQAIQLEPDFGEAYYRRYYARQQLGDPQAIEDLQRSIQLLGGDLNRASQTLDQTNQHPIFNKKIWNPNLP